MRNVFSTKRWVSDTETVIIARNITIIPSQALTTGRGKTPEAPPLRMILWRDWRGRTKYSNEVVIGRAHRR
ncbi:hypothetical protein E2C01_072643 [Portunus trituberculatus]|uniref:Uncharacterized protein n=1 Tax=Portunus trituberculatus TaxID=210409 RepID=A0A5B7HYL0_PORTR|nr:hypothetical protein [Portunus trituberculatus]